MYAPVAASRTTIAKHGGLKSASRAPLMPAPSFAWRARPCARPMKRPVFSSVRQRRQREKRRDLRSRPPTPPNASPPISGFSPISAGRSPRRHRRCDSIRASFLPTADMPPVPSPTAPSSTMSPGTRPTPMPTARCPASPVSCWRARSPCGAAMPPRRRSTATSTTAPMWRRLAPGWRADEPSVTAVLAADWPARTDARSAMSAMPSEPTELPVHALSAAIQARKLSPVELTDALLTRIERLDGKLHAFIALYAKEARLAAEAADKAIRSGHAVGPLHGIPIAVKDLVELEGRVTTGGSKGRKDRISPTTATLPRQRTAAGLIVLGKTHTDEFAMGGWGTNEHMGTPWNPWDLAVPRSPGGSSSGSGVAVAARLAPCAIGTDTGGSVRLPASWCGITGLKTTIGRISVHGVLPLAPTLDTPGPMTRSVEDAAILFNLLQGPDPLDHRTLRHAPDDPLPTLRRGVVGLRLAGLAQAERRGIDAEVLAAYDEAVETLGRLGARIV